MSETINVFAPNYVDWANSDPFSLKLVNIGGTPRDSANLLLQWVSGAIVTADTVWFTYKAPYPGTINSMTYFCDTGSFTVAVQIAGSSVTGLSSISNNSATPATASATGANTFTAGQAITAVVSSPSGSPTDALLSLNVTWS